MLVYGMCWCLFFSVCVRVRVLTSVCLNSIDVDINKKSAECVSGRGVGLWCQ